MTQSVPKISCPEPFFLEALNLKGGSSNAFNGACFQFSGKDPRRSLILYLGILGSLQNITHGDIVLSKAPYRDGGKSAGLRVG